MDGLLRFGFWVVMGATVLLALQAIFGAILGGRSERRPLRLVTGNDVDALRKENAALRATLREVLSRHQPPPPDVIESDKVTL